jgi:YD repeat-containing protein
MTEHRLTGTVAAGGLLFECDSCGRRLGIDRTTGELVIIDHGDRAARHRGSIGDIELTATVTQR